MWVIFAFGSAFFAGLTSILAKCGINKTDSTIATAIRTIVVLFFSWIIVFIVGSQSTISTVDIKTWVFLILSGFTTGASWLCFFRALQLGSINKVVSIDKFSTVLTIIMAIIFLREGITWIKVVSIIVITIGTYLMIQKENINYEEKPKSKKWLVYAFFSALFASLTTILGKVGINGIESNLGTAIRTGVVLIMAWGMVFITRKQNNIRVIPKKELMFICLSGLATGISWLCYYKALQGGPACAVSPIDKLSIIVTIIFSYFVFKEKLQKKAIIGLSLIVIGTLAILIKI